jgi:hypothetical protein
MERGAERNIAIAVLSIIAIVGVLATATLFLKQPTGQVMQEQGIYVSEDASELAIECENRQQIVYFLGYEGNFAVYCCPEKMNGQNECMWPHKVLITRKY